MNELRDFSLAKTWKFKFCREIVNTKSCTCSDNFIDTNVLPNTLVSSSLYSTVESLGQGGYSSCCLSGKEKRKRTKFLLGQSLLFCNSFYGRIGSRTCVSDWLAAERPEFDQSVVTLLKLELFSNNQATIWTRRFKALPKRWVSSSRSWRRRRTSWSRWELPKSRRSPRRITSWRNWPRKFRVSAETSFLQFCPKSSERRILPVD